MNKYLLLLLLITLMFPQNVIASEPITWKKIQTTTFSTGDWTPPITRLFFKDAEIIETIHNGDFSKEKDGWEFGNNEIQSEDGNTFVVLNSHEAPLTQEIQNSHGFLMFSYKPFTEENLQYFDVPSFVVKIQGKEVYSITSEEIKNINTNDWISVIIPLFSFNEQALHISFSSGNTGDSEKPSWTYLDNVTTRAISIYSEKDIRVISEKASKQFFKVSNSNDISSKENLYIPNGFSTVSYWSEDKNLNTEKEQFVHVFKLEENSTYITNIDARKEYNNEIRLKFDLNNTNFPSVLQCKFAFSERDDVGNNEWKNLTKVEPMNSLPFYQLGGSKEYFFSESSSPYISAGCLDLFGNVTNVVTAKIGAYDE